MKKCAPMRSLKTFLAFSALALVLAGCGGQPTSAPASSVAANSGTADWQQVVAAAKREGNFVISGPPTDELHQALTKGFV